MDTSNPAPLITLAGGVVMLISTFLDWRFEEMGLSTDSYGLMGILTLIISVAIMVVGARDAFGLEIPIPDSVLGLSLHQAVAALGFAVFFSTFGTILGGDRLDFGIHLAWIGAAVTTVGGLMGSRSSSASATGI